MKKWYPPLAFGALLIMLCSWSLSGTMSFSTSANESSFFSEIAETMLGNNAEFGNQSFQMMADTQLIPMPLSSYRTDILLDCDAINRFYYDTEHLYPDTVAHRDTLTICPPDASSRIFISFTDFEVAAGDTLYVYDADSILSSRLVAKFSGVGVSATGGWIKSECNPSGCLTFEFVTNGDNVKGTGWDAWVTCEDNEDAIMRAPDIPSRKLDCGEVYDTISICPPDPLTVCNETLDTFCLKVYSHHDLICIDTCFAATDINARPNKIIDTFGIGIYKAVWSLKKYPSYKIEKYFSVQGPTMVCNDEITVPFGSACAIDFTPDMLLENPCDTITDTMYYKIEFTIGKNTYVGGGGPGVPYPSLTRAIIEENGGEICGGMLDVKISQVYYEHIDSLTICHGGIFEQSCSTKVNYGDITPPVFFRYAKVDTLAACDTTGLMSVLKTPTLLDNCDASKVFLHSLKILEKTDVCGSGTLLATWKAVDLCGNEGFTYDTIRLIRPDSIYNPGRTILSCSDNKGLKDAERPGLIVGQIKNGELIPGDTLELSTTEYVCGYILVEKDQEYPSDCGAKLIREWKLLDWCNPDSGPQRIATQAVTITDTLAPVFIDCPDSSEIGGANNPMEVILGHFDCEINVKPELLGIPRAIDDCDPNPVVSMFCIEELWHGEWRKIGTNLSNSGPLACDTFRIGWLASDACHEQPKQDTCYKYVIIKDLTKPSAICADQINFSIGSDWARIVNVEEVDAGSWDACGIASREISFDGEAWGETALLSCEDIHHEPKLYLRVTDTKGNQNICWTKVVVKDDVFPTCGKLPDAQAFCDEYKTGELGASTDTDKDGLFDDDEYLPLTGDMLDSLNKKFGNPLTICEDNVHCAPMVIEQEYQLVEWPCGMTRIKRRYRATDWGPNSSAWETQIISLEYRPNWKITFPADWEGECGEVFPEPNLNISSGACDQIGWEHEDKVFEIQDGACYKVERTYHVINWCLYEAGQKPYPIQRIEDDHGHADSTLCINHEQYRETGYFTYIQVLRVHSFGGPDITINNVDTCLTGEGDAFPFGEADNTPGEAPWECDELVTFTAEANTCVEFATIHFEWCVFIFNTLVDSGVGSKFVYPVAPDTKYRIRFKANDGCGNSSIKDREFIFTDCKKPTPYCRAGVNVEMGQEGKISLWASDVDLNSFDNCTPAHRLHRKIWHRTLGEPPSTLEEVLGLPNKIDFDCDNFGNQVVRLYVIDETGQWDYCATTAQIQDNMRVCVPDEEDPDAFVSGSIHTPDDELMNEVQITATATDGSTLTTFTKEGSYNFTLSKTKSYSLRPELDNYPLNGVTTFDLVLISKHILGLQSFNSPYQYIAADINRSGTITAFDMVQLRQLILSITETFPNNTSWRFVEENYAFASDNPAAESFPETVNLSNMSDQVEVNFMAVKIGDLNGSARFDQLINAESRGFTTLQVREQQLEAGETYNVDFFLPAGASLEGYQFTLNFSDLELVQLKEGIAKKEHFGFRLQDRGLLTTSWNISGQNDPATNQSKLFSLIFKATANGSLSEKLRISSDLTPAEAYESTGNITHVKLQFKDKQANGLELYQNRPNPFKDHTNIGFYLPEAGSVGLSILDVQGKVLKEIKGNYAKGYHEIQLTAKDLSDTGILYYQLSTDKKQVVKRMIVVE